MKSLEMQAEEVALFMIKHDALQLNEDIYARIRIQQEGLTILYQQEVEFTPERAREFYADKLDKKFPSLVEYITAGKSLAMVVYGKNCYKKLHSLKKEMRSFFNHGDINTGTHSSDDYESTKREMQILNINFEY